MCKELTLWKEVQIKKMKKLISSDDNLSSKEREMIFDALRLLCNDKNPNRFKQRIKIHEVKIMLNNPDYKTARKGFLNIIKLYGKKAEVYDIIGKIKI